MPNDGLHYSTKVTKFNDSHICTNTRVLIYTHVCTIRVNKNERKVKILKKMENTKKDEKQRWRGIEGGRKKDREVRKTNKK